MLAGVIVGGILGWLIATMITKKKLPKIKNKFNELRKQVGEENWQKGSNQIQNIFGEVTDDSKKIFRLVKNELILRLRYLELEGQMVDESTYIKTVQETIQEIQKRLTLADDIAEKLQDYWENNFENIKNEY
jgi:cell division protein FtsN